MRISSIRTTGDQQTGAVLSYALLTLWIARRFLWKTMREIFSGEKTGEVLSSRTSYLILAGAFLGIALLSLWAGMNLAGMLVLVVCLLLVLILAIKLRAETGYPGGGFFGLNSIVTAPQTFLCIFGVLGAFSLFKPSTAMFWALFVNIFLGTSVFFFIPGLQMELITLGHRLKMLRRDIIGACILGVIGGIVIGGWVYLSGAYSVGASNFPAYGEFSDTTKPVTFINDQATEAMSKMNGEASSSTGWINIPFCYGAGVTVVLTAVRQLFAGFWFHPFGFVLGASGMMYNAWGSLLVALVVRFGVLKIGGAATVRQKLLPFAVGCILGIVAASLITSVFAGYLFFFTPGVTPPIQQY